MHLLETLDCHSLRNCIDSSTISSNKNVEIALNFFLFDRITGERTTKGGPGKDGTVGGGADAGQSGGDTILSVSIMMEIF